MRKPKSMQRAGKRTKADVEEPYIPKENVKQLPLDIPAKAWLKASRHLPKRQFFQTLKRKLIGHYNYYYVRGNSRTVWSFYRQVILSTRRSG